LSTLCCALHTADPLRVLSILMTAIPFDVLGGPRLPDSMLRGTHQCHNGIHLAMLGNMLLTCCHEIKNMASLH
jgi:hypothetical protein